MKNKATFFKSTNRYKLTEDDFLRSMQHYEYNYSKVLPSSLKAKIVELGCSEGIFLNWLGSIGYEHLAGIDSDHVAISIAKNRLKSTIDPERLSTEDALTFVNNCLDESVEMFVMINIIEHLEKDYLLDLIPQIIRVLKPGGKLLIQTGNIENPFNLGLFTRDFTHQIPFTTNSLRQLMILCGFDARFINLGPVKFRTTMRNWPLQISTPIAEWLVKIIGLCMRIRIRETAPLIYCVAKKGKLKDKQTTFEADR